MTTVCAFLAGEGSCTCWPSDQPRPCLCRKHPGEPVCAACPLLDGPASLEPEGRPPYPHPEAFNVQLQL